MEPIVSLSWMNGTIDDQRHFVARHLKGQMCQINTQDMFLDSSQELKRGRGTCQLSATGILIFHEANIHNFDTLTHQPWNTNRLLS